ncbi:ANTAR domain-containing protein [Ferrovibrio sp.]|uniref:ANTAR domain-containing response regulator n=1 Tax=Ferrovibrio sp. TaxID=1917215 RepID=UPI001B4AA4B0|nr:ANTAR domain-containing protein [Ferrovibrio sp.]MBP7064488.1 ANTAR domain-containing protein [Ferrovibrio sp.]
MSGLRILLIDENPERAAVLNEALRAQGYELVARLAPRELSARRVAEIGPDIVIVDMDSPSRDTIESMRQINDDQPRPIVMFVDQSDVGMIEQAMQAGVSAYIIDGLNVKRVKPILDVAIARFREFQALRDELKKTKATLNERKLIERAKGMLMREKKLTEDEAYAALRRLAMDRQQKLVDVAETLLAFADLLKK